MEPHQFSSKMPPESKAKGQSTSLIQNWRSPWRAMEVSEKATPDKSCNGCNKEKYWRYLRVAIWGNEGLPDCMKKSEKKVADQKQMQRCWCLQTLALLIVYLFLGFDSGNGLNRTSSGSFSKFTTSVFLPENKNPVSKPAHFYVFTPVSKMHVLKSAEWYFKKRSKTISRHFAGSC